jgi:hypothetical protein
MMDTEKLIGRLAEANEPVEPLPRSWIRTATWLLVAIPYVGLVVYVVSPRSDLIAMMSEWRYVVEQIAALATAITAANAAFATTIPAHSRRVLLSPLPPLAVWVGSVAFGCVESWIELGRVGLLPQPDWFCFPAIVLVGAVPAIAMAVMLRRGAPLTPHLTTALGGLAAAGLGAVGLRLFHVQDASLTLLVWQVGSVCVLTAMAAWTGRYLLDWRLLIGAARRKALIP